MGQYQRYERPPLFYPTTAILKQELEKQLLWDVLKHLKNLESRSLKEVEEIPERAELRRVVFFPKRAIPNFLHTFPVIISMTARRAVL